MRVIGELGGESERWVWVCNGEPIGGRLHGK